MPSLTQLEYVVSVDKHRHFGKASKASHISQPTLSQQIQKLEEELDITIFDRIQKPIVPTEEGAKFIEQARVVLREHQRLLYLTKNQKKNLSGTFRLAIIPTISTYLVPLFLKTFVERCPGVELYIDELKTETIIEYLKEDRLDAAILATPLGESGLKEHPLYYESFALYASHAHELLKKKSISVKDLERDQMWMLKDGNCFKNQVSSFCSVSPTQDNVFPNVHFQSGSLDTLCHIIQKNQGYTLIPELLMTMMAPSEIKNFVRFFTSPEPTREVSVVYRRDHWKQEILKEIENAVLETLPASTLEKSKKGSKILPVG